jgi:hypothetical protein
MIESIRLEVYVTTDEEQGHNDERELEFRMDTVDNLFRIYLEDKEVCFGDWSTSLRQVFKRALEIWPE